MIKSLRQQFIINSDNVGKTCEENSLALAEKLEINSNMSKRKLKAFCLSKHNRLIIATAKRLQQRRIVHLRPDFGRTDTKNK